MDNLDEGFNRCSRINREETPAHREGVRQWLNGKLSNIFNSDTLIMGCLISLAATSMAMIPFAVNVMERPGPILFKALFAFDMMAVELLTLGATAKQAADLIKCRRQGQKNLAGGPRPSSSAS